MVKKNEEVDNKINKKQIEEIKNNLYDEVKNMIEIESKKTLDNMGKKFIKYKNSSIRKRNFIIIILFLLAIFEGYVIFNNNYIIKLKYDNVELEKEETAKEDKVEETNKETEIVKDDNWYKENYSYLLDNIKLSNVYYLYEKNYKESDIKDNVRLDMAYSILKDVSNDNNVITISEEDIKDSYKKIFGSTDNYKATNFNNNCISFIYNEDSKNYMAINTTCENIVKKEEVITKIYEENNKIIIETKVGFYDSKNLTDVDKNIIKENFDEKNIDKYLDKLSSYKYTFKDNNGIYSFYKIEKLS